MIVCYAIVKVELLVVVYATFEPQHKVLACLIMLIACCGVVGIYSRADSKQCVFLEKYRVLCRQPCFVWPVRVR